MDALINTFHLDVKLIFAQAVNFLIVLTILYFVALKPLTRVMHERTERIDRSLSDAEKIDQKLKDAEKQTAHVLSEAKREASRILESAHADAEQKRAAMIEKSKREIEKLIQQGKVNMAEEKERMIQAARAEVGALVIRATEKVLSGRVPKQIDAEIISEVVEQL